MYENYQETQGNLSRSSMRNLPKGHTRSSPVIVFKTTRKISKEYCIQKNKHEETSICLKVTHVRRQWNSTNSTGRKRAVSLQ